MPILLQIFSDITKSKRIVPDETLSYSENFLYMLQGKKPDQEITKILDVLLILHADHEQNASTSNVRATASAGSNLLASITAGIASLWGRCTVAQTKPASIC